MKSAELDNKPGPKRPARLVSNVWVRRKDDSSNRFGSEGGSGTPVPALSVEVDDVDAALEKFRAANIPIEYGPADEPCGVRTFYVREPNGRLVNVLQHL